MRGISARALLARAMTNERLRQEVAGLLRVRVQTVRKWCSEGWLSYHKLNVGAGKGSAVRIHRSVMLDLLQRGYVPEKNDI
jgi:hypothetical protein